MPLSHKTFKVHTIYIHSQSTSMVNYVFHTILSNYILTIYIHSFTKYEHGKLFPTEEQLHTRRTYLKLQVGFQKKMFGKCLVIIQEHNDKNDPSRPISPHCVKCLDPDK